MHRPPRPPSAEQPFLREAPSGHADEEESALVARAERGDAEAFEALVRAHYARIHRTAFRLVGNHEDAEDLAQDCFVRAQRSFRWYRGQGALAGWLRRILVHLARDRFRAVARRPASRLLTEDLARSDGDATTELGRREFEGLLRRSVDELPERLRLPLVLRTMEGLSYEEVARACGVTPATARTQVMQARRELRRRLARALGDERSRGRER